MVFRRNKGISSEAIKGIKYLGALTVRTASKFILFPLSSNNNLILLESYLGTRLDCNPLAMYNYLKEQFPGKYRFVWVARDPKKWAEKFDSPDTQVIKYRSLDHLKVALTASVVITNDPRPNELPSRSEQIIIQTWHGGGCYKKVGTALDDHLPISRIITTRQVAKFKYFVSSSAFFTSEVIRKQYVYNGNVIESGMPRNDCLVTGNRSSKRYCEVRRDLSLSPSDFFVLFAPTWRDYAGECPEPNLDLVKNAFEKRFRRPVTIGIRGHYYSGITSENFDRHLNEFDDMQGLLLAADAVITDYSSLIWDYSFTYRPCFLFTPDLKQYERDRGFDVDIHEWGFPVCETSEALVKAIENFDEVQFRKRMVHHHEILGSFETGHACEAVAKVIEEHCFGNKETN